MITTRKTWRSSCALTALFWAAALFASPQQADRKRDLDLEPISPIATARIPAPRSYAVVIGVAAYQHLSKELWLHFAERDADEIYSVLISPTGGNFPAENVHLLTGERATLANLRHELEEWLPGRAQGSDRVLIYFAGHGFVHAGAAYLAPYDFDTSRAAETGYGMDALGRVAGSALRSRWKVLITDACHSGAISPGSPSINNSLLDLDRSLFLLTATSDRESSYEGRRWGGGHGAFTYYVVEGLKGAADETGDGIVTADELAEYVHTRVRNDIRDFLNASQNPNYGRGSFAPDMPLSFPGIQSRGFERQDSKFGGLVFSSTMDGVSVYVDGDLKGIVSRNEPLRLPGLRIGSHTVQGVKTGYEPDGPREEIVYPDQDTPVPIRIRFPQRRDKRPIALLEEGVREYRQGSPEHYRKAALLFQNALDTDSSYAEAALYLARAHRDLFDADAAARSYRRAIEIDPSYLEARTSYAGMLLDRDDADEAIRQLNTVSRQDPKDATALYLTAQAFLMKESYGPAIEAARKSIGLAPNNPEPHLFLAEAWKLSGTCASASPEYQTYLRLSDFDSGLAAKLNYYVGGFLHGRGRKVRPAQRDIWRELRSIAWAGLGDCERIAARPDAAIDFYKRALTYGDDPRLHFAIGCAYTAQAEAAGACEPLRLAYLHFRAAVALNPELAESATAARYMAKIEALQECRSYTK